jgi:hypothetical protein
MNNLNLDTSFPGRDVNQVPPRVLPSASACLVNVQNVLDLILAFVTRLKTKILSAISQLKMGVKPITRRLVAEYISSNVYA